MLRCVHHSPFSTPRFWGPALALAFTASVLFAQGKEGFEERDGRYRLQPTDVIEVHYRYTPEFNETVTIQPDGFAALAIVGDLKLEGLTLIEAKTAVLKGASQRLRDPEISLILKEFEKPYFMVDGEVAKPGRFEMRGVTTPLQAIAMAGGFKTASAKHSQVILVRKTSGEMASAELLDLKAAVNKRKFEELPTLHPGDMLIVPQNRLSKIERFIQWGNFGIFMNPLAW